jgi:hypothetical protein
MMHRNRGSYGLWTDGRDKGLWSMEQKWKESVLSDRDRMADS